MYLQSCLQLDNPHHCLFTSATGLLGDERSEHGRSTDQINDTCQSFRGGAGGSPVVMRAESREKRKVHQSSDRV